MSSAALEDLLAPLRAARRAIEDRLEGAGGVLAQEGLPPLPPWPEGAPPRSQPLTPAAEAALVATPAFRARSAALVGLLAQELEFFTCRACRAPFYGGRHECARALGAGAAAEAAAEGGGGGGGGEELTCMPCSVRSAGAECPTHGAEFVQFKCRFCCSLSTFHCSLQAYPGVQTHFCGACHAPGEWPRQVEREQAGTLPACPAGPCGVALPPGSRCPLNTPHPKTGVEFIMGCALCRIDASARANRRALGL